jgi:DNA-binding transcriptional LysR family regulator
MDRKSLECFIALAEELHFHRAAARCHISQPGISQQLRRLEDMLRVQLLIRSNRQVALTRAGKSFLVEARRILKSMEDATSLVQQIDRGTLGHLRVGATASSLFITMPEIVERFREALPEVQIQIEHMTTAEQEAALKADQIDVGICHPPMSDPALHCELLAQLPFDLVMSRHNPLAQQSRIGMEDLREETFLLFPREVGPRLYDEVIALCQQHGFSPRRIIEVAPAQTITAMATCNMGVGLVASKIQHFSRSGAVFRRISGPAPYITFGAAHSPQRPTEILRTFLAIACEVGLSLE